MCQRFAFAGYALDQAFDAPAAGFAPEQTRRNDPGVIENHQVTGLEETGQIGENTVVERTGIPVQVQQPAGRAFGERFLGDQFRRQIESEITAVHGRGW